MGFFFKQEISRSWQCLLAGSGGKDAVFANHSRGLEYSQSVAKMLKRYSIATRLARKLSGGFESFGSGQQKEKMFIVPFCAGLRSFLNALLFILYKRQWVGGLDFFQTRN